MGLEIRRLEKGGELNMSRVLLSKKRVYLNADKTKVVPEGSPEAAFLLVGEGSVIAPDVAEFYGVETYDGEAISRMPRDEEAEFNGMVTAGVGTGAQKRYDEMILNRRIREDIKGKTAPIHPQHGRQAELMAQGVLNQAKTDRDNYEKEKEDGRDAWERGDLAAQARETNEAITESSIIPEKGGNVKIKNIGGGVENTASQTQGNQGEQGKTDDPPKDPDNKTGVDDLDDGEGNK